MRVSGTIVLLGLKWLKIRRCELKSIQCYPIAMDLSSSNRFWQVFKKSFWVSNDLTHKKILVGEMSFRWRSDHVIFSIGYISTCRVSDLTLYIILRIDKTLNYRILIFYSKYWFIIQWWNFKDTTNICTRCSAIIHKQHWQRNVFKSFKLL